MVISTVYNAIRGKHQTEDSITVHGTSWGIRTFSKAFSNPVQAFELFNDICMLYGAENEQAIPLRYSNYTDSGEINKMIERLGKQENTVKKSIQEAEKSILLFVYEVGAIGRFGFNETEVVQIPQFTIRYGNEYYKLKSNLEWHEQVKSKLVQYKKLLK